MRTAHKPPACCGIDVGKLLHVVIAVRVSERTLKVIYLGRLSSFADVTDVCARLGVNYCVVDAEPETRAVREWQSSMRFPVFLADYISTTSGPAWNESERKLRVNRTEALDSVHSVLTSPGRIILPRRCGELDEFAKELQASARVIEEDSLGGRRFVWRKLGADHFFHSMAYCLLAATQIAVFQDDSPGSWKIRYLRGLEQENQDDYNPLTFGLGQKV